MLIVSIPNKKFQEKIHLPASKSESNRVLIIEALAKYQNTDQNLPDYQIKNISDARDTQTMLKLLQSQEHILDVLDAGTTMRFLTAFCAITRRKTILTGTPRMQERPIKILIDALTELGANIKYLQKTGFPPIEIIDFEQKTNQISIEGNVSSQYISALLMIAPLLKNGLELHLQNKISSQPYILMTLELMKYFGIIYEWNNNIIFVKEGKYQMKNYAIEADWSAASYWYSIVALAETGTEVFLPYLKEQSLQGDSVIAQIMQFFGVETIYQEQGVKIKKINEPKEKHFTYDFAHCPDLAQTIVALCLAKNINLQATGLESLRIKETDRTAALAKEAAKLGYTFTSTDEKNWFLKQENPLQEHQTAIIATYEDHRMAMAFAPLAMLLPIGIENENVVEKSYPNFWEELKKIANEVKK
ncbi:MAG: 3-phosphoshikimate 1-carboxyvinyltransferase [Raineya sp.]